MAGPSPISRACAGCPANVEVGVDIDRARFVDLLVEAIASFG